MRSSTSRRSTSRAGRSARELAAAFAVADHLFFREIARLGAACAVFSGAVGDPDATMDALVGLGEGCPNGGMLLSLGAHAFAVPRRRSRNSPPMRCAQRFLPQLASGAMIGAFAATEAKAGSDVMAMETRYAETRSGYVLNGEKAWITNATQADVFVVFATKDVRLHSRGISAFLVERATPGRRPPPAVPVPGHAGIVAWHVTLADVHIGRESADRPDQRRRPGFPAFDRPGAHPALGVSRRLDPARADSLDRACADPAAIRRADRGQPVCQRADRRHLSPLRDHPAPAPAYGIDRLRLGHRDRGGCEPRQAAVLGGRSREQPRRLPHPRRQGSRDRRPARGCSTRCRASPIPAPRTSRR